MSSIRVEHEKKCEVSDFSINMRKKISCTSDLQPHLNIKVKENDYVPINQWVSASDLLNYWLHHGLNTTSYLR